MGIDEAKQKVFYHETAKKKINLNVCIKSQESLQTLRA